MSKAQKYPLFDDPPFGGEEFGDFSFTNACFSSEAGAVLNFFASFFGSS